VVAEIMKKISMTNPKFRLKKFHKDPGMHTPNISLQVAEHKTLPCNYLFGPEIVELFLHHL
jgi:hypothetical protein